MKLNQSFRHNEQTEGGRTLGQHARRERARASSNAIGSATAVVQLERLEPRRLLAGAYHWPVGPETLVNTYTPDAQFNPSVAMDADGDHVVAWTSYYQDGSYSGVYAQRYNPTGAPEGPEFRVNTGGAPLYADVAMDADGDFVITWSDFDGSYGGIFAQRYNAAGVPQGEDFRVNAHTTGSQFASAVAMDDDGDFVLTWNSTQSPQGDIYARRYNADGTPQGAEFRVNSTTTNWQQAPDVAIDADGDVVIAWQSSDGSSDYGIFAQRFNGAGVAVGPEFRVNTFTIGQQYSPAAAMDSNGNFLIAWESAGQDGSDYGIFAQRYSAAGVRQGSEFRVNSQTADAQEYPAAAMSDDGDFVVTWGSYHQDGSGYGTYAQRYNAVGLTQGTEFRVNTYTPGLQYYPSAAMDADGDFVIAWESKDYGDYGDVHAQRYTTFGPAGAANVGDRVWNDADSDGIQDGGESGIAGAGVTLYNGDNALAAVTTTDAAGQYAFLVPAGASGVLRFGTPPGLIPTRQDRGGDDARDSDADRVTAPFPVGAAGTSNTSLDAGFCAPATISGAVFFDRNGDGARNGGEEALAGFELFADFDNDGARDADEPGSATGPAGTYTVNDALGGAYPIIVLDQDTWVVTATAPLSVPTGGAVTQVHLPVRTAVPDSASSPLGGETRVNTFTGDRRSRPSVAMDADGDSVVVWQSAGQDGSYEGIYAQRYNSAGVPQGPEFRVNSYTPGKQWNPSVAMDADGDFVIAWQSNGQEGGAFDIYAQRFNAAGVRQGPEFRVNTFAANMQEFPSVAMDADGDFVIAWDSLDQLFFAFVIYAQRFNAAGAPQGTEFLVSPPIAGPGAQHQRAASAAMDADGDFAITWQGRAASGSYDVFAQRYSAAGLQQGPLLHVNSYQTDEQRDPAAAMDADGDLLITWTSYEQDGSSAGVYAQRYNAAGVRQGTEFQVNTYTTNRQLFPAAAMSAAGDFVVTWASYEQDGSKDGVYAQRYNAAGVPQETEFRVNASTLDYQTIPAAAMDADGDFVVAWASFGPQGSPPANIFAQRYAVSVRPAVTASQFVWQTAPQRIEFTFDQDVSASLTASDLVLTNLTTGATIPTNTIVRSWNAVTKTATFTFPTLPNGGSLPDGTYRATLPAAAVTNAAGTSITVDYALQFFFLAGDANHDGRVTLQDFNILAANFGQTNRDFSQGDFNYDTIVNLADFNILAGRFGNMLTSPQSAGEASFSSRWVEEPPEQRLEELI